MIEFSLAGRDQYSEVCDTLDEKERAGLDRLLIELHLRVDKIVIGGMVLGCPDKTLSLMWMDRKTGKCAMSGGLVCHRTGEWTVNT